MRWCIETDEGAVLEVTNLFDLRGVEIDDLDEAASMVIRFTDRSQAIFPISAPVHSVQ